MSEKAETMRLRYAARCRLCSKELAAGTAASYDREAKKATCEACFSGAIAVAAEPQQDSPLPEVFAGTAGASARYEHDRRKTKRETRIREAHPIIGGLMLALSDDPQSTKAWATGALGEEALGRRLDRVVQPGLHVLHDRRILPGNGNIDHIVIGPAGVFVIDAKKYENQRPSLRVEGGIIRPRVEKLMVGSRDKTSMVEGVYRQIRKVEGALNSAGYDDIIVHGMLCFVGADWPVLGGDFSVSHLSVLWPRLAVTRVIQPGPVDAEKAERVYRSLAATFPPSRSNV